MSPKSDRLSLLADSWLTEANKRHKIWEADPIANALALCASELRDELKNVTEVDTATYAARHHTTPQTVRRWCRQARINARMVGGDYLIPADEKPPSGRMKRSA